MNTEINKYQKFRGRPLLQREIEIAQANSSSSSDAARYLQVGLDKYTKWAKYYGIYDRHLNQSGKGISKKRMLNGIYSLKAIFDNKHPKYGLHKLKVRMIAAGLLEDKCNLCGFNTPRHSDGKVPVILHKKDGDSFDPSNLELRCYNCSFLTTNRIYVKISDVVLTGDITNPEVTKSDIENQINITQEELENIQMEALKEINQ